jgi:hypothetical protein
VSAPGDVRAHLDSLTDSEELTRLLVAAARVDSLEDFRVATGMDVR